MKHFVMGCLVVGLSLSAQAEDAKLTAQATTQAWTPTDGALIDFKVLRKGQPFGHHRLEFSRDDTGALTVETDVKLSAGLGPITLYRYRLESEERWIDGELVGLTGACNNDGEKTTVEAQTVSSGLQVAGSEFDGVVDLGIVPSSHWNRNQVYSDQMVSTESGEIIEYEIERLGREMVKVGDTSVEATRYRLKSDLTVDLWYDDLSRWVKLTFDVRDQSIEYVLQDLY
ncbi:MAG: DUF6134 family protein [Pseudomonadota bacterium]